MADWGHDFRPDYRRLRTLLRELPPGIPVLATTATANARVSRDVAEQLGAGRDGRDAGAARPAGSRQSAAGGGALSRPPRSALASLAEHLGALTGSGIVYALTVAAAHETAGFLRERGHPVAPYTGRDERADRQAAEDSLLAKEIKELVATSALGMGFDKPDLGSIVHLGAPQSPSRTTSRSAGRAGGSTTPMSSCFPAGRTPASGRTSGRLRSRRSRWCAHAGGARRGGQAAVHAALETRVDLFRRRLEMMLKVLDVDGAVRRVSGGWAATGQDWVYDGDRYTRVAAERSREQQAMLGYISTGNCRMEYLRRELDDPAATPCGRCDNCTGRPWPTRCRRPAPPPRGTGCCGPALRSSRARCGRPGCRSWASTSTGKIGPDLSAEPGRALGRLTDLGWGSRLRAVLSLAFELRRPGSDGSMPRTWSPRS